MFKLNFQQVADRKVCREFPLMVSHSNDRISSLAKRMLALPSNNQLQLLRVCTERVRELKV